MSYFPDINQLSRFEVVFFDLDNTIYPYTPAHKVAQKAALEQFSQAYALTMDDATARYKAARHIIHDRLHGQASSHSRLLYFKEMIQALDGKVNMADALVYERAYWHTFLEAMQPDPQAMALIKQLKQAGKRLGIITDLTTQIQLEKFNKLELWDYFDCMITSEEAGIEKPNEGIFALALQTMNTAASNCAMIGDNPDTDGGAEAIGMTPFIIQLPQ
ncbi:MAG: HAD-IA family hydrolase [Bacteroidota bacterium]